MWFAVIVFAVIAGTAAYIAIQAAAIAEPDTYDYRVTYRGRVVGYVRPVATGDWDAYLRTDSSRPNYVGRFRFQGKAREAAVVAHVRRQQQVAP